MENFNYTGIVVFATMIGAAIYWYLPERLGGARHHFKGPISAIPSETEDDDYFDL